MQLDGLDILLKNSACLGAFVLEDEDLRPLSSVSDGTRAVADRTLNFWASLKALSSDSSMVIGKRKSGMSVASENGGIILESRDAVNLGMLRASLQKEDVIIPSTNEVAQFSPRSTHKALWTLAEWIDGTELPRCFALNVGEASFSVLAEKGRFAVLQGPSPEEIGKAILQAGEDGSHVELSLEPLPDHQGSLDYRAIDLFDAIHSEGSEWVVDQNGFPSTMPRDASFTLARDVALLAQNLTEWCQGEAFELSVLRTNRIIEVIATKETADIIRFSAF